MMLLAFGSLGFWIACAVIGIFCTVAIANEWPGRATLAIIAFMIAIHFLGGSLNILAFLQEHLVDSIIAIIGYFAVGSIWSIIKWYFFMKRLSWAYIEMRGTFLRANGYPKATETWQVPENLRDKWLGQVLHTPGGWLSVRDVIEARVSNHKKRIMIWISYWPFSALWTLIDDPFRWIVRLIYDKLSSIFGLIGRRVMAGVNADRDVRPEIMNVLDDASKRFQDLR